MRGRLQRHNRELNLPPHHQTNRSDSFFREAFGITRREEGCRERQEVGGCGGVKTLHRMERLLSSEMRCYSDTVKRGRNRVSWRMVVLGGKDIN